MTEPEGPPLDRFPVCAECGKQHAKQGRGGVWIKTCNGHVKFARGTDADNNRIRLPEPLPCQAPCTDSPVCYHHSGQAPQTLAKKQRNREERKAREMANRWGMKIKTTPTAVILDTLAILSGQVAFYAMKVAELRSEDEIAWGKVRSHKKRIGDETSTEIIREARVNLWVRLHDEAVRDRFRCAAEALKIGISAKMVEDAQNTAEQFAAIYRAVFADLDLTPEQNVKAQESVVRHLRLVQPRREIESA